MSKLWGGRFEKKEMDPKVVEFTSSLNIDKVLAKYDCISSKVHVEMLAKCGYISTQEKDKLVNVLDGLLGKISEGAFNPSGYEDIHSAVQGYVENALPEESRKMHTARSRNEQVVNDVRLYCLDNIKRISALITEFQKALVDLAEKNQDIIIPGYTHLNRAQPVLFSHLVMSYVEMLERDSERMSDLYKRADVCVMGSGAIAGSSLKLDRKFVADKLGFSKTSANSIDAVSDRDFMIEFLAGLCFVAVHLSRISEDMILYSTSEFGLVEVGADYCTGSSLMPQKKNPDVFELVRGKAAGVIGGLNVLLTLLKGLPHAYNRDLQEDKKVLFESVETVAAELAIMKEAMASITVNKDTGLKMLEDEFIYATDLAEYLVGKGMAFKDAHDTVGAIVKHCSDKKINISDLSITELKDFSEKLEADVLALLNPAKSISLKKTEGSTNPENVKKEISGWRKKLK